MDADSTIAWTGFGVITETGVPLGWVKNTILGPEHDSLHSLVISLLPYVWLPRFLTGSCQLSTSEIVSYGPNRLIAFEGSEHKVVTQTVSGLEWIGLVRPPWHQNYKEVYPLIHEEDAWNGWSDDGDLGNSPISAPREPGPNPLNGEAEVPTD
ncbi:hypothetical protein [Acaryochloris sp. IP29b_bin.148]|uniref:hypothetical protein n=1 Tax=Acaryochloris sp. IP29b_bin.148 TaxID=2969218 RepID=UPI002626D73A|nr:hypothetical protein [Acaryochloris sp. IP29b_bin.148]